MHWIINTFKKYIYLSFILHLSCGKTFRERMEESLCQDIDTPAALWPFSPSGWLYVLIVSMVPPRLSLLYLFLCFSSHFPVSTSLASPQSSTPPRRDNDDRIGSSSNLRPTFIPDESLSPFSLQLLQPAYAVIVQVPFFLSFFPPTFIRAWKNMRCSDWPKGTH